MSAPLPQSLHDRARRLSAVHGTCAIAEILQVNRCAVYWMRKRGWRQGEPNRKRPMPADFAIQVRHMPHNELRAHYGAASVTVTRWRRELREGRG